MLVDKQLFVRPEGVREMTNSALDPAFNLPSKPLSRSRVAIVTTAALRLSGQDKFVGGDQSFRILPATTEGLILGQISPNFDRSGFIVDPNVVFPIDRLNEMAAHGLIGSVAPQHIAFLGAQGESLAMIIMDTGPAAAKVLKDEDVDRLTAMQAYREDARAGLRRSRPRYRSVGVQPHAARSGASATSPVLQLPIGPALG